MKTQLGRNIMFLFILQHAGHREHSPCLLKDNAVTMRQRLGTMGAICTTSGKHASENTFELGKPLTFAIKWLPEYTVWHDRFEWGHYS